MIRRPIQYYIIYDVAFSFTTPGRTPLGRSGRNNKLLRCALRMRSACKRVDGGFDAAAVPCCTLAVHFSYCAVLPSGPTRTQRAPAPPAMKRPRRMTAFVASSLPAVLVQRDFVPVLSCHLKLALYAAIHFASLCTCAGSVSQFSSTYNTYTVVHAALYAMHVVDLTCQQPALVTSIQQPALPPLLQSIHRHIGGVVQSSAVLVFTNAAVAVCW